MQVREGNDRTLALSDQGACLQMIAAVLLMRRWVLLPIVVFILAGSSQGIKQKVNP